MKVPFSINMKDPKTRSKSKQSKAPQILITILAVLIAIGIDCVLPGLYWWLLTLLSPQGFWQMIVTIIISFYALLIEGAVLLCSTMLLLAFLAEVVWS